MVSSNIFPCLLLLNLDIAKHVNFADLGVSLPLSTFCVVFPMFLWTGISPDFTWIFIECGFHRLFFFRCILFLAQEEKETEKKKPQKSVVSNSVKNIRPESLSRRNAIYLTLIIYSEKSNDLHKLMPLGDFSLVAFSGRSFFGFDLWLSFLL